MRMTGLVLDDIAVVDLAPYLDLERALRARGIEIVTLADELRSDPTSWAKLRDTNQAAQFGWLTGHRTIRRRSSSSALAQPTSG